MGGIAAAMALQWMPTLLGYCKIRTSRPKTVNEMLHAARLSLAATPDTQLPLNHVAHVDADPRAAPIQLGGGQEDDDGPSLESNQRPWLEESPLPRIEVASALHRVQEARRANLGVPRGVAHRSARRTSVTVIGLLLATPNYGKKMEKTADATVDSLRRPPSGPYRREPSATSRLRLT